MAASKTKPKTNGVGQLSLVEHALCPLDSRASLGRNQAFETGYFYSNQQRQRKRAKVQVFCPLGLAPKDELNLWGMLALTLASKENDGELIATRHYILSQLGIISGTKRKGGRQYAELDASLLRLSTVTYCNDSFYDPIRAEHRKVSFGFFSFTAPQNEDSSRAWRIAWDPVFFDLVKPVGGTLRFNFGLYSELDPASRRLFLFLSKVFSRRTTTPRLDLQHLGIDILGYSHTTAPRNLRMKVMRAVKRLEEAGLLAQNDDHEFQLRDGRYSAILHRGRDFFKVSDSSQRIESPLLEPLRQIGLDDRAIQRTIAKFPQRMLNQWVDITLAAKERRGRSFFRKSPAAYLIDNLNHASKGTRLPPDWWHDIRKAEDRKRSKIARAKRNVDGGSSLPEKAVASVDNLQDTIFDYFLTTGQDKELAKANSRRFRAAAKNRKRS